MHLQPGPIKQLCNHNIIKSQSSTNWWWMVLHNLNKHLHLFIIYLSNSALLLCQCKKVLCKVANNFRIWNNLIFLDKFYRNILSGTADNKVSSEKLYFILAHVFCGSNKSSQNGFKSETKRLLNLFSLKQSFKTNSSCYVPFFICAKLNMK